MAVRSWRHGVRPARRAGKDGAAGLSNDGATLAGEEASRRARAGVAQAGAAYAAAVGATALVAWLLSGSTYVAAFAGLAASAARIGVDLLVLAADALAGRRTRPALSGSVVTFAFAIPISVAIGLLVVLSS